MIERHVGLYTDMYQLTMGQAYFRDEISEEPACFDYFFRKIPFEGGYVVFAGLADALSMLERLKFEEDDLQYLSSLGFDQPYVDHLKNFRFAGDIFSAREGDLVFPLEPVLRVEGGLLEAQIVETLLLNILNFESLVATKASRMRLAAGDRVLSDFGLRRAHGWGGILASRAAVVGGFDTTSNVFAAREFGLRPAGTMAHSFVESHSDELEAFRRYAAVFPDNCVLLVDTYDTLRSGVPNAIAVGRELAQKGHHLAGIRMDSGDLAYLSKKARLMLDAAGLSGVKIVASNQLDEHLIKSLLEQGAPIDIFGVGTRLVTGFPDGALDGVYKLSMAGGHPRLKLSETIGKITLPGRKKILRCTDADGFFQADAVALEEEGEVERMFHPFEEHKSLDLSPLCQENLHVQVMERGKSLALPERAAAISAYSRTRLAKLPPEHKRFENPHIYRVGLSRRLMELRAELVRAHRKERKP
ncbi:MAG: nicotinate phosphoribosyltransferase [Acidobacteriota bacterium]